METDKPNTKHRPKQLDCVSFIDLVFVDTICAMTSFLLAFSDITHVFGRKNRSDDRARSGSSPARGAFMIVFPLSFVKIIKQFISDHFYFQQKLLGKHYEELMDGVGLGKAINMVHDVVKETFSIVAARFGKHHHVGLLILVNDNVNTMSPLQTTGFGALHGT